MNNEHYCLVWEDAYGKLKVVDICPPPEGSIPLYTHPAKTLKDEDMLKTVKSYLPSGVEIATAQQLGWSHEYMLGYNDALCEVRMRLAILRKAQE